jgi:hypothetical protein
MRKKLMYTLLVVGVLGGTVAVSPRSLGAQADAVTAPVEGDTCKCNGGCENLMYYSYCGNGMCSWFCTK